MFPSHALRGGIIRNLIVFLFVGIAIYIVATNIGTTESKTQAKSEQKTPEQALKYYLTMAYKYMHNESGVTFHEVQMAVTADDWSWYENNYKSIHVDTFNIGGGIDPNEAEAIARRSALHSILTAGPSSPSAIVKLKDVSGTVATFNVKYKGAREQDIETEVKVVREGEIWKVKDFAGGRTAMASMTTIKPRS